MADFARSTHPQFRPSSTASPCCADGDRLGLIARPPARQAGRPQDSLPPVFHVAGPTQRLDLRLSPRRPRSGGLSRPMFTSLAFAFTSASDCCQRIEEQLAALLQE